MARKEPHLPRCHQVLRKQEDLPSGLPLVWPEKLYKQFPFLLASSAHLHLQTQMISRHCCVLDGPGEKKEQKTATPVFEVEVLKIKILTTKKDYDKPSHL